MKKLARKDWSPWLMNVYRSGQLVLMALLAIMFARVVATALVWAGAAALTLLRHIATICQA